MQANNFDAAIELDDAVPVTEETKQKSKNPLPSQVGGVSGHQFHS